MTEISVDDWSIFEPGQIWKHKRNGTLFVVKSVKNKRIEVVRYEDGECVNSLSKSDKSAEIS
jgi:hypothetical protein